MTTIFTNNY